MPLVLRRNDGTLREINVFVWDVEGTIMDSVRSQYLSFYKAIMEDEEAREYFFEHMAELKSEGKQLEEGFEDFTLEQYHEFISGRSREGGICNLLGVLGREDSTLGINKMVQRISKRKDEIFQAMLQSGEIASFPETIALLRELHAAGIRMVFASGSSNAATMLLKAGVLHLFEVGILKGRVNEQKGRYVKLDVSKVPQDAEAIPFEALTLSEPNFGGKPFPWIFLRAANEIGADHRYCATVEDSPQVGEQAYEEAFGCSIIMDTGEGCKEEDMRAGVFVGVTEELRSKTKANGTSIAHEVTVELRRELLSHLQENQLVSLALASAGLFVDASTQTELEVSKESHEADEAQQAVPSLLSLCSAATSHY